MDKKDMPRRREAMELRIRRTMAALEKNNMSAYYAPESADAVRIVEELLGERDVISCGGSVTLDASGVKALMRSGKYDFLDRDAVETDAERQAIYRRTFSADAFLTSSNAITERGELFNIDGGGNRVAAMLFGPKKAAAGAGRAYFADRARSECGEAVCEGGLGACQRAAPAHRYAVHACSVPGHGRRPVRRVRIGKSPLRAVYDYGAPAREGPRACHFGRRGAGVLTP